MVSHIIITFFFMLIITLVINQYKIQRERQLKTIEFLLDEIIKID